MFKKLALYCGAGALGIGGFLLLVGLFIVIGWGVNFLIAYGILWVIAHWYAMDVFFWAMVASAIMTVLCLISRQAKSHD